jgi:DNA-binding IclR family transcriptional regulator
VLLALLPDEESAAVIKANEQRLAHHQLTPAKLAERMRAARAKGYAYTDVGVVKGTRAVAVPVLGPDRSAAAAISLAAIADRLSPARLASLVGLMKEQAELVSRRLAELERARRRRQGS